MITIYSKSVADGGQALRFQNPHEDNPMLVKPTRKTSPEDAARTAVADSSKLGKKKGEFFVDTTPGQLQHLPDWVAQDQMFAWALKHGWIVQVETKAAPMQQEAEAKRKLDDNKAESDLLAGEQADADELQKTAPAGAKRKRITGAN